MSAINDNYVRMIDLQLPDVTSEMKELQSVIDDGDLEKSVEEGQQRLKNIEQKISQTVSTSLDAVRSAINDAGRFL